MSLRGDFRKVRKAAEQQGFRVDERKEYFLFWPPDGSDPCRIGHTPSSQRTRRNFLACLKRKGYKP
jgi:hypothetical protein